MQSHGEEQRLTMNKLHPASISAALIKFKIKTTIFQRCERTMPQACAPVLMERKGHVAVFTLNRPEARNAVNAELVCLFASMDRANHTSSASPTRHCL